MSPSPRTDGARNLPGDRASFAVLLRAARTARGLTQEQCAARAGIGVRTLRDLERGTARPQQATVDLLVAALELGGTERDELIAVSGRHAPAPAPVIHLPPLPTLIGRDDEVTAIVEALARRNLITLAGVAGVGKTSLGLAAAHRAAAAFPGGTSAVVITEVSTEDDVLVAIASVFDVARVSDLSRRFDGREALLLLDSVERAAEPSAAALARLAAFAPTLRVLATSRHPIGASEELVWPVGPLPVPPDDMDLSGYPAVDLFLARLNSVRRTPLQAAEMAAVGRLVRRIGGLPLALELAAARGRVLDVAEILDRYGERVLDLAVPSRSDDLAGTAPLRGAIGESYRLVGEVEQGALRRLGAFRHRWSLDMAEAMLASLGVDPVGVLDRLIGLGLVQVLGTGPVRFRVLDVVRDFACEQRDAAGETDLTADRHAEVIAATVARIAPDLVGTGFLDAVKRLDEIASDIRAALSHARRTRPALALSIAAGLPRWWRFRGRDREGRGVLRSLLDAPGTRDADPLVRAWSQLGATLLAHEHGEAASELAGAQAALSTFAAHGDVSGQLAAHTQLVAVYHSDGVYERAREHGAAALALATRSGRRRDILVASTNLTWHDIRTGDLAAARSRLTALRTLALELGEDRLAALALANLTEVERLDGRYAEAVATGRRTVAALEQFGDPRHKRSVTCTIAIALAESGRSGEAAALVAGLNAGPFPLVEAYLSLADGDRAAAARAFGEARRSLVGQPDVRDVVEALVGLAATAGPDEAKAARAELEEVCAASAVTLLPRDLALLAEAG